MKRTFLLLAFTLVATVVAGASAHFQQGTAETKTDKPDIWEDREITLPDDVELAPVVVAIWDSGTDVSLFPGQVFVNPEEVPANGLDDDANGYLDDVNGIGWSWDGRKNAGPLRAVPYTREQMEEFKPFAKGSNDIQIHLDSPEASALREHVAALPKKAVRPFFEGLNFYHNYAHGTHVAGIAARGNRAIRLLVARMNFPYRYVSPLPTVGWADRQAAAVLETIGYFRKSNVRVVSMSWGYGPESIEHALAQHKSGRNAAKRTALAHRIFDIVRNAFLSAIADAPEILFVSAVGNSPGEPVTGNDIPSSFELPNTISVGALDAAGEAMAFTSLGKVDLYANGYEVESMIPGGDRQKWSGTSMASPQAVNLAAKLLAMYPALTIARLRDLIIEGCDEKILAGDHPIRLLNAKRSFELSQEKFSGDPTPTPSPEG